MDKKVSLKKIDKIIKNNKYENNTVTYKCGDEDISIEVIPCVDYTEWYGAIETATKIVFMDDGEYKPEILSMAYDYAFITCFTNIKTDNVSKVVGLSKSTDIVERISNIIPEKTLNDFRDDFYRTVEYKAQYDAWKAAQ